jgi:hypothetical protein
LNPNDELLVINFEMADDTPDSMLVAFEIAYVVDEYGGEFTVESEDGYAILEPQSIDQTETQLPTDIVLKQNYPNPFNSSTVIKYGLPYNGFATIDVFDIMGRNVASLSKGYQQAGYYETIWHANDVPSGVYFYRLKAGEYSLTGKMVLLK